MITLHSTNCPKCKVLEMKLKQKNIEYTLNTDVSKLIEKGYKTAPILQVNEEYMDFNTANKWINNQ